MILIAQETTTNNYSYDDLLNTIGMMILITLFFIIFFKFRMANQIQEELEYEIQKRDKIIEEQKKEIEELKSSNIKN
jgi:cell division protein FtsL